jgi:hypothetical protein
MCQLLVKGLQAEIMLKGLLPVMLRVLLLLLLHILVCSHAPDSANNLCIVKERSKYQ